MKPTRNRVFCLAYGHHKMLFESEQAANNFIKYNHDEILEENGKAPTRAYYCDVCSGWHVTSMEAFEIESSYDILKRRVSVKGQRDLLDCDLEIIRDLHHEGKYEETYLKIIDSLRRYKNNNKLVFIDNINQGTATLFLPFLSDCLEHFYSSVIDTFNKELYEESMKKNKALKQHVDKLTPFIAAPSIKQLRRDYLEKAQKMIDDAQEAIHQKAVLRRENQTVIGRVNRRDCLRIPELLELSQKSLQNGSPYESIMIAYDMFDTYTKCKARNYVEEEEDINSKVYTHIIDIVMHLVALVDEHIQSHAFVQAEIELDEFLTFFTDKFAKYEDDPKMMQIYNSVKSLLEHKQNSI